MSLFSIERRERETVSLFSIERRECRVSPLEERQSLVCIEKGICLPPYRGERHSFPSLENEPFSLVYREGTLLYIERGETPSPKRAESVSLPLRREADPFFIQRRVNLLYIEERDSVSLSIERRECLSSL